MSTVLPRKTTSHAEKISLDKKFPNGFCSAPFSQLYIHANGDVYVCCQHQGHLGNLKTHTLEELWNGERALSLRREFLNGKPQHCKKHMEQIGCHINYDELLPHAAFEEKQLELPRVLEIVLNGKCNIACKMCEIKDVVQSLLDIPNFKTEIEDKLLPQLKHLYLKGGEPLIQKETYHVLKKLKEVNPDCTLRFITNGQYNFNDTMKRHLDGIHLDQITMSIDSSDPELFSAIRVNGSLEKCEKTLADLQAWAVQKKQDSPVKFTINITVQKDNWSDVPRTLKHYHEQGHSPCLIYVYYPQAFSLSSLTENEQVEILKFYINLPAEYDIYTGSFYHVLKPLLLLESPQIRKLKILWDLKMQELVEKT